MNNYSPSITTTPCRDLTFKEDVDMYPDLDEPLAEVKISNNLPTKPNSRLCSCMMQTINCIPDPKSTIEERILSRRKVCDKDQSLCAGISFNSTEGWYGSYLMCNHTERAAWAYQQNYLTNGNDSAACSSIGGISQQPMPSVSLQSDCQVLLRQAGPDGRGTVTFDPATSATESSNLFSIGKGALGPGAKIGIGVSIGSFALLSIALGIYFWFQRRRTLSSPRILEEEYQKAELPDTSIRPVLKIDTLLDSGQVFELRGDDVPKEMNGEAALVEADGGVGIMELATEHNKRAELEASQLESKGDPQDSK
jgi:hypothetical protein